MPIEARKLKCYLYVVKNAPNYAKDYKENSNIKCPQKNSEENGNKPNGRRKKRNAPPNVEVSSEYKREADFMRNNTKYPPLRIQP